ncbi:Rxt3-domain-containing protein [Poronia punctata]|nr:Rxt3-domain-containing protein [Poronia punctata]
MDSRQPHSQPPYSRNNAASPSYSRSPFPPASGPAPTSSSYPPRPIAAPTAGPSTSPGAVYAEHNSRRPSETNAFYHSHSQPRAPPPYSSEPNSHPAQTHSRHPSSSSANNAPIHRAMPPPSPPQHPQHGSHAAQHQAPPPHQIGGYGGPPAPRAPPVNLGPPNSFPSGRELPALNSLPRVPNAGSMSISSMLGGPSLAHREATPGHPAPYHPPSANNPAVTGPPSYAGSVHASPRMQNAGEYSPYHHRRPQTPESGRPPFEARDHRGSTAGSPPQAVYGTPEASRYGTPQAYQQRHPPMGPATEENRREPLPRGGTASVPPRPSSQPRSYHGMAPRSVDMGRGPPPGHGGDPTYVRREEGHPPAEFNHERGPPRPISYEEQQRLAADRDFREARETEFRERERRERDRLQGEEQRAFIMERERFERERERERERDREREMEMQRVQRERTSSDPSRPPGQHPGEPGPHPTSRQTLAPHYGRPDSRDPPAWQQRPGYDQPPREGYGHPFPGHRPGEFPATTGHPYGSHPAYAHPPAERFPPTSQPPHHAAPTNQPGPQQPHPYDSPDRLRFAPAHAPHHPQPPPHQQQQQQQQPPPPQPQQQLPQRGLPPGGRPAEEGPPPPSVAYSGGPGGATFEPSRPRPVEDGPTHLGPQRGLLGVPDMNRKGRLSPLPQTVQGPPHVMQGPGTEPGIKSEFGRMFSGIGSGVRGIGVSSPGPSGPAVPYSNPNIRRGGDEAEPLHPAPSVEAPAKQQRKRRKAKEDDSKGDDDSTGRATPVGRKRAKTHAHHHHHHHHHHHPHHHAPERTASPLQGLIGSLKGLKSTTPIPSPASKDYAFTHHHQVPRSHPNAAAKPPPPGSTIVPKPKQKISSQSVLDSVADRPRKHLGDVVYSVVLKPAKLDSTHSKFGYSTTPRPLPMDMIKDNENSSLTVKVPRVHLTPSAREEITTRRAVWGTDVYSDDSDVVAACIHAGWIRGEWSGDVDVDLLDLQKPMSKSKQRILPAEQHLDVLESLPASGPIHVPADRDLHVTLLILPPLEKYASTTRYGIQSREFGGIYNGRKSIHDGLSFMIQSVRWVDGAAPQSRLRGKAHRERIRKAMSEVNRSQVVELGEKEVPSKEAPKDRNREVKQPNGEGDKENHPAGARITSLSARASPADGKASPDIEEKPSNKQGSESKQGTITTGGQAEREGGEVTGKERTPSR